MGSGEFEIPQWEFRGQSPLAGRRSASPPDGRRCRGRHERGTKKRHAFSPMRRKVLGFACFLGER
ncbi:MAG: hypothetical protein COV72_07105 [Candidatus Omnitrophica bacterium CG11_big_fil_rev_8_21_14_0_20_42_13]|uniref:Uncharacterized protein n=1 Tax=Candidatus Ghiorseimicrobium undicola TaxID=1974746 RepID=A0A2H0LWB3_9BACT|nr:MAG: hypothetical protein COV72_07105 [Candidatus Omnitrophica bacterium CG11_big_fil_rev_8_21_14_0_20_42_13]